MAIDQDDLSTLEQDLASAQNGESIPDEDERLARLDQAFIDKLVAKIMVFMEVLVGFELFPYQKEPAARIIESIIIGDAETITLHQSRQSGKSETLANVIATLMIILPKLAPAYPELLGKFKDGFWIGVFAPVTDQAETIFGRIVTRLTSKYASELLIDPEIDDEVKKGTGIPHEVGKVIRLKNNGSFVRMQTANPKAKIESKSYHMALVDEAQDADDVVVTKCVAEGTPVWTPDGPRPVEEVVAEQLSVMSYDKPWDLRDPTAGRPTIPRDRTVGELVPTQPTEWHDNGVQAVWRITTASGRSVEATANHRWAVRRRRGNSLPFEATTEELEVGFQLPLPVEGVFGSRGTEDEGYFAGQIVGDGCTTQGAAVWCCFDDDALSRMEQIAHRAWGSEWHCYTRKESGLLEGAFVGGGVRRFLRDEGLAYRKGVGKGLFRSDYSFEFWKGYVAGIIDSDGSVSPKARSVDVALISERAIRQIQDGLHRLGILSRVSQRPQNGGFGAGSAHPLFVLTVKGVDSLRRLRELVTLSAGNKDELLTELVESRAPVQGRQDRYSPRRVFGKGQIAWDRITSIEYVGRKRTYCVTVEPSHTVVWAGFAGLNSISPMLAFYAGTMVLTGSSSRRKNYFYRTIRLNKRRQTRRGSRQNHFEYDWKFCAKYNKNYALFIRKEMVRIGEDSDEFLLSYGCKWLLERGMFATSAKLDELGDVSMEVQKQWMRTPVVVGIDPARTQDSTVVTVVFVDWDRPDSYGYYDHRVLNWLEIHGDQWEEQYFQIVDFLGNYSVFAVAVDGQGMGDVVADRLDRLMPGTEVIGIPSNSPDQSKRWKHLTELMNRGRVSWPAHAYTRRLKVWKRFRQQMEDLEKKYQGPHLLAAAPDEAMAFDDFPDSLALACVLTKDLTMPEAEQSSNVLLRR